MPTRNVCYILVVAFLSLFISFKTSIRDQIARSVACLVQRNSLSSLTEDKIYEGALAGMMDAVQDEPYTTYLPPSEQPGYMLEIQGRYTGVGLSTFIKDSQSGEFYFVPQRNSPASKAGLKFGDRIVEVDGRNVADQSIFELTNSICGEENTTVKLKIRPRSSVKEFSSTTDNSNDELTDISFTRTVIQQDVVLGDRLDDEDKWIFTLKDYPEIGYIAIEQFVDSTGTQTRNALEYLENKGVSKVILDFRGNPGGILQDAVAICNELLALGSPIVETRDKNGNSRLYEATRGTKRRFKVAVLIDGESASASEIVASALQDAGVAIVIGSRSYGKGTVQSIFELPFHSGALRMTTASFWRPSGKPIHRNHDAKPDDEWGVVPDSGYEIQISPLQGFYQRWIRRIRASSKDAKNLDARTLSFMNSQMTEIEHELQDGSPLKKAEKAAEIGLSLDEVYSMLQQSAPKSPDQEEIDPGADSNEHTPSPNLGFIPSGRAPYFDPQLDKAIDYFRESESNSLGDKKIEL